MKPNLLSRLVIAGFCVLMTSNFVNAQSVGIAGTAITPEPDALFELRATDKGALLPRMDGTQRTAYTAAANSGSGLGAAEDGMTIYNTTTKEYNVWDGTQWIIISGTTSGAGFIENQIVAAQSAADFWIDGKGIVDELGVGTAAALSSRVHIHDASATAGESLLLIDDNASSPVLQVQDIGRVGIGTATPISTLDVVGKGTVQFGGDVVVLDPGYVAGASLALGTLATPDTYLRFGNSGGTLNYLDTKGHDFHIYSTATTPGLYFQESDGFVGIGTTSPLDEMHVEGSIRMVDGNEAVGRVPVSDANGTMTWTDPSAIDDGDWTLVGFDIERQSGNVYIGNTNTTNNDLYISNHLIDWDNGSYFIDPAADNRLNQVQLAQRSAASPSLTFISDNNSGIYQPAAGAIGWTINGTEGMRLDAGRDLGIGTTNPTSKLHVLHASGATPTLHVNSTTGSSQNQTVNISRSTVPGVNNDMLQITVPAGSPDDFQFVEFDRNGAVEFSVDGDGDVDFDGALEPNGLSGTAGQVLRSGGLNASPTWVDATTIGADLTTASNGLTETANDIQLGGTLTQATTVTQGANNMSFNLNSTGDFRIMDGGTTRVRFEDGGRVEILGTTDASGTAGSGVLEIGDALRFDNNEIITNTNAILYINNDNGGDVSMDGSTFRVDASANSVGIGTTTPTDGKLQVEQTTTADALTINHAGANVGQVVNISKTSNPSAGNDIIQITVPGTSTNEFQFVEFDRGGNVEFSVDGDGDVDFDGALEPNGLPGTAGQVLRSGGANNPPTWVNATTIGADLTTASNGLTETTNDIRLGGTLVQATTINQGTHAMNFNLNSTGDFNLLDNGTIITQFRDDGVIFHGDDMYWRDGSYAGTNLMALIDDGNDGRLLIYENGVTSVDLDANSQFVFNEQGLDRDFRIESDDDVSMFRLNANDNRIGMRVGATPVTVLEIGHTAGQQLMLSRQDGTITTNEQLGGIGFDGSDGNTPDDIKEASAAIIAFASESHGTGDKGGHLTFWTSPTNQNDDTDGLERMRIEENGEIGIGTTAPTQRLDVNGNVRIRGGAPAVGDVLTATNTNGTADWQEANNGVKFVPFHNDNAGTNFWTHPDINVRVSFNDGTEQVTFHNNSGGWWDAHIRGDNGSSASAPTAISNDVCNGCTLVLDLGGGSDGGFTVTAGDESGGQVQGFTMQMVYWGNNMSGLISYW